jgi:bifunctional non-homologous end joining protein LigD
MIFDIDPADGEFSPVRTAARKLRAFLNDLGLEAFLKTTGSKGLHVMVPLDRSADFEMVRAFARSVANRLAEIYPQELTVEQRKDKRTGRVYLDVLRNAYGQTAVSAYSVRARPGAPVSTPLHWEELENRRMDSRRFNIWNIFRRLAQSGDPWAAIKQEAFSIKEPQKQLNEIKGA